MRFFLFLALVMVCKLLAQTDEPLYLNITFPTQSDTVNADQVRLSGNTHADAILRINNRRQELFPQGSFVTRVNLAEGMNQIILTAQKNDELVQDILFIYRPPKKKTLPEEPTAISKIFIAPENDMWLMNGDFLSVEFQGSPAGQATFSLEKFAKDIPMSELPLSQTNGIAGIYHGVVRLQGVPEGRGLEIEFELTGVDRKRERRKAPGKVFVLSDQIPRIGQTMTSTFIHSSANGYSPFTRLPDSVKVHIIGRENGRFKINLLNRRGYIDAEDVKLEPVGSPLPLTTVGAPRFEQDTDWFRLLLPIGERVPFRTHVQTYPLRVELTVYGAYQVSHWITYPNSDIVLQNLELNQIDDSIFFLAAELDQEKSWGHKIEYRDGLLELSIRRQPMIDPLNPLKNLVFALDPGHGGEETGATSPLGVFEKDVNWQWAESLATMLRQSGAKVVLTRSRDETVSLPDRLARAEAANALFFLSLHNNATSASGNALRAQGTSVYFTLSQNKELAWAIYPHMVKLGLSPYGRIYNSYFVTNATSCLVALVEGGFLTHPDEELRLADKNFINEMARAVYWGVLDFLKSKN